MQITLHIFSTDDPIYAAIRSYPHHQFCNNLLPRLWVITIKWTSMSHATCMQSIHQLPRFCLGKFWKRATNSQRILLARRQEQVSVLKTTLLITLGLVFTYDGWSSNYHPSRICFEMQPLTIHVSAKTSYNFQLTIFMCHVINRGSSPLAAAKDNWIWCDSFRRFGAFDTSARPPLMDAK